jgi:hypothetical protein
MHEKEPECDNCILFIEMLYKQFSKINPKANAATKAAI